LAGAAADVVLQTSIAQSSSFQLRCLKSFIDVLRDVFLLTSLENAFSLQRTTATMLTAG